MKRIETFRAMSSSAYVWLANYDPVRAAFVLALRLDECASEEADFKVFTNLNSRQMSIMTTHMAYFAGCILGLGNASAYVSS